MIVHCWRQACLANLGRVVVAAAETAIVDVIKSYGGEACLTDPNLPSGTDRINAALEAIDPDGNFQTIINMQGDLPLLDPVLLSRLALMIKELPKADMATLAALAKPAEYSNPNVVKMMAGFSQPPDSGERVRALAFSRATIPWGDGPLYHHIGLYGYRRDALRHFVTLPPSPLERREKLEQMRALEAGMSIYAELVSSHPLGVDTAEDLATTRLLYLNKAE